MTQKTKDGSREHAHLPIERADAYAGTTLESVVARCAEELRTGGPSAALAYLNGRTRFRYTGMYQVDPPMLRNVHLFDRENPDLNVSGTVAPLDETYCGISYRTNEAFSTPDALHDARLRSHAARESVLSYDGVPIRMQNGLPSGSLCHYDIRPRLLSSAEQHILEAVSPMFARWLAENRAWPASRHNAAQFE